MKNCILSANASESGYDFDNALYALHRYEACVAFCFSVLADRKLRIRLWPISVQVQVLMRSLNQITKQYYPQKASVGEQ